MHVRTLPILCTLSLLIFSSELDVGDHSLVSLRCSEITARYSNEVLRDRISCFSMFLNDVCILIPSVLMTFNVIGG